MSRPQQFPSTCISGKPHDHHVSNVTIHYNGCLRESRRRKFFESLPPDAQARILRDNEKVAELRHRLETAQCDSTAAARLRTFKQAMAQWHAATGRPYAAYGPNGSFDPDSRRPSGMAGYTGSEDLVNDFIKAPVFYFKGGRPMQVPGVPGSFPSQKVTMATLLSEDETRNPIMQPCDDDVVRYFHLPANNMIWVEEVLARYYHEKRPLSDCLFMNSKLRRSRTKTEALLRPEYWQGQQNFDHNSEVHARHMRPFCDSISVDFAPSEAKNIALFMPYLHWETDRGRVKSAEIIKEVNKQLPRSMSEVVNQAQHQLHPSQSNDTTSPVWVPPEMGDPSRDRVDRRRALGHVFRTAAALMEAMDHHTDEQLMTKYLHAQPPLHPRRTLDQSYYGALKSTRARDRDQVVYRGTTPEHHDCDGMDVCAQCNEDIRKVPRIIMVDQLWLWILDERTVISCFPRRWGRNRPDPSAVHKSIRARLQYVRPGEITSAYDLTLMIVDECSRVFFDRAKMDDRKPNLVDLFACAIRDLAYKQTAAFDQFLIYTHLASRDYNKRDQNASDNDSTQNTLLNINPEGNLLKEVKDVVDEIHIMMRIKEQQQTVMESLVKQIRRIMLPVARPRKKTPSQVSTSWDLVLGAAMDSDSPYADGDDDVHELEREHARQTLDRADQLLVDLSERISELQALLQIAMNTSSALKDILTLKQQQAGVIEAREAVKQAQLTLKQGQSIMIFTIVTIVFLPLSFCVGFFGMNSIEFNDGKVPLDTEYKLMFPISAGIIFIAFLFAFSRSVLNNSVVALMRSSVSFGYNTALTWLMVKTGLYVAGREMMKQARRLRDRENKITGAMKAEVMRKEKNLEKMRAAGHVRQLAMNRSSTRGHLGDDLNDANAAMASGRTTPFSPYSTGAPGSPFMGQKGPSSPFVGQSPFLGQKGSSTPMSEVDVELGERRPTMRRIA